MRGLILALLAALLAAVVGWAAWAVWGPTPTLGYACAGLDQAIVTRDAPTMTTTDGIVCLPA